MPKMIELQRTMCRRVCASSMTSWLVMKNPMTAREKMYARTTSVPVNRKLNRMPIQAIEGSRSKSSAPTVCALRIDVVIAIEMAGIARSS